MRHRGGLSGKERQARSSLAKMVHENEFVCGSIVTSQRRCGKSNCWCKQSKTVKHQSSYVSVRIGNKRKMIYVPENMVATVKQWVKTYRQITQQLSVISQCCVEKLRQEEQDS